MSIIETTIFPTAAQRLISSRRFCERLTKSAARNFYYGLKLLPEPKRSAMFALYAYMRLVDDIADDEDHRTHDQRVEDLETWRQQTHEAMAGKLPPAVVDEHELWPAFAEIVRRHALPAFIFDEVIAGQRQDLEPICFHTFKELHKYCYRVAGVVGLASIYVWGFEGGAATEELAVARGVAFQLTNILRDLREDAARGRIYLPREDLSSMNVTREDLLAGRAGKNFNELMHFQIARAEAFYEISMGLEDRISRDSRSTLVAMTDIYRGLLRKVAAEPERVLRERVSLSLLHKLRIGWRAARASRVR
jgi:phytoene synthase